MVGNRLKELRIDNDYTQDYIADMLNLGRSTYANYENNRAEPGIDTLKKLSKFYNVSIDYICSNTDIKFRYYIDQRKCDFINKALVLYDDFLK